MSTRSCPEAGKGARLKTYSRRRNEEEDRAEKAEQLKRSKAGLIGALKKLRGEIWPLLTEEERNLPSADLAAKLASYDKTWKKFVNAHECLIFMEIVESEPEKQRAQAVYDEELARKIELDGAVKRLRRLSGSESIFSLGSARPLESEAGRKTAGTVSTALKSSRVSGSSSIEARREQMALAKLNVEHLKRKQELERKLTELNYARQLMEAEMEAERAYVSFSVLDQEIGARKVNGTSSIIKREKEPPALEPIGHEESVVEQADVKLEMKSPKENTSPEPASPESILKLPIANGSEQPVAPPQENITLSEIERECEVPPPFQSIQRQERLGQMQIPANPDTGEKIVKTLCQVLNTPKIEYMHFDGNPINYVSFMRNFETCLEDGADNSRNLQFLIQHCTGKARDAIESCVNLPVSEGYESAKKTLEENFGLPHVIAKAHVKKLEHLPPLKVSTGSTLLEFARHLEIAERTLRGMGPEFISDLNHTNTLMELNRKLPYFMRGKWAECAGRIIESGRRPKFSDFLKFVKDRAKLVNNEFGEDLVLNSSREKRRVNERGGRSIPKINSFTTKAEPDQIANQNGTKKVFGPSWKCPACSGQHGLWKCEKFRRLSYEDREKLALNKRLCFKCLNAGHFKDRCPKETFKCQVQGCVGDHNTLLHPDPREQVDRTSTANISLDSSPRNTREGHQQNSTPTSRSSGAQRISQEQQGASGASVTAATGAGERRVCLGVLPVKVKAKGGTRIVETYALLDSGSEVTLCKEQLFSELGTWGSKCSYELQGVTGSRKVEGHVVDVVVMSVDGEVSEDLLNVRTVEQIPVAVSCIPRKEDISSWSHLRDIDLPQLNESDVGLIIGLKEKPTLFVPLECRSGGDGEPVAVRYSLGWTVMGPLNGVRDSGHCSVNFVRLGNKEFYIDEPVEEFEMQRLEGGNSVDKQKVMNEAQESASEAMDGESPCGDSVTKREIEDEILQEQLEKLWKTDFRDSVVSSSTSPSIEDTKALEKMERSLKMVDGHFQVALPWRTDPPYLPNNRSMVERRAALLRKRLLRDQDLFSKYNTTMKEYIEQGHAERVPTNELRPVDRPLWYLPHHPVMHPLKPEKVRVVFDCAAQFAQTSLNKQLLQGPDLTNRIVGVLSRFRQETVGLTADIQSMFHQVRVEPKDCDALRFLWWPGGDLSAELVEYRMVKHIFGATSSPSVVNFCLKKTAMMEEQQNSEVANVIDRNMYVDDLMKSTETVADAISLADKVSKQLNKGGFHLTKWCSNDRRVLAAIPEAERAKTVVNLELEQLPTQSALGMKWNIEDDKFVWEISDKLLSATSKKPVTRRSIVSIVYSLFDPLGFIAPYVMKAKLILQMLSRKKIGWDEPLKENENVQWMRWLDDLSKLKEVTVDRCFKPKGFAQVQETQLHLFSDASRQGYSAAAYFRVKDVDGRVHCSFIMGKARLAPIREISIPRLELTAAVISVKLSRMIRDELDLTVNKVVYWTDSTSVLKCISNETKRFHTFESNRLTIIHDGSTPHQWRYVNREDNPADDGSKGLKLDVLIKNDRWLTGPKFLWEEEECWPAMVEIPILKDDDPEVRKENQIYVASARRDVIEELMVYYSSWWKLKVAVSWILRYKRYLKDKILQRRESSLTKQELEERSIHLTLDELREAEHEIFRYVQAREFPEVIALQSEEDQRLVKRLMKKMGASVSKLNPQVHDGLLRVGGRIGHAPLSYDLKHPVILPYKHHVTDLIIKDHHLKVGHMGQESVLSSLRQKYWILKGRSAVRRVLSKCFDCQKRKAKPAEQFMAELPKDRVTPSDPPFTYVGVDCFGPIEVKQGRSLVKRYGCLFTCLTVRAVHIEILHSMSADSMIDALRRFISMRGCPKEIRSDNGTNFTSADKELRDAVQQWNHQRINNFCAQREIKWTFNPPDASHMGGVWERMIQTAKRVLKALLKEQVVTDEVLSTVMAEVVTIVNSRPLTRNSDSISDDEPISPNHLLHLRPTPSLPPGVFVKGDLYCKRAWRQAQYLTSVFWRRWSNEYLPTLMERRKWRMPKENIKAGDLVLLADKNYPRGEWPIARVVEAVVSSDGFVRAARVRTASTVATHVKRQRRGELKASSVVLTRPITSLCPLEMDI